MPKTRRNRKGGKRRKSMKGGDGSIENTVAAFQSNVSGLVQAANENAEKLRETAPSAAASKQKLLDATNAAQQESEKLLAKLDQSTTQEVEKMQGEIGTKVSGLKSFMGGAEPQDGITPEEAKHIAMDNEGVRALMAQLKMNVTAVGGLIRKIEGTHTHTDEHAADIAQLQQALSDKEALHKQLADKVEKTIKETVSAKYLRHDTAHHLESAGRSVQAQANRVVQDTQDNLTNQATNVIEQANEAQERSTGFLTGIGNMFGFGNSEGTGPTSGGRRRKKSRHPKKGQKSKTRKGRLDFVTHKGDKYYNRKGHRQTRNRKGKKGRPYGSRKRKAGTKKKHKKSRHPKKGQKSKTRKGHLDFVTHKGDKYYNRKGHRQRYNRAGVYGRPYQMNDLFM